MTTIAPALFAPVAATAASEAVRKSAMFSGQAGGALAAPEPLPPIFLIRPDPAKWMPVLGTAFIPGKPIPGGSKTATVIRRKGGEIVMKNGRPLVTTRDDAKGNAEWKAEVKWEARRLWRGDPIPKGVPVWLAVVFYMPRLSSHFGTGRNAGQLKANAPTWHTVKPDGTKLMRALEDALTGIVWTDDAQVVAPLPLKVYAMQQGANVEVYVERGSWHPGRAD